MRRKHDNFLAERPKLLLQKCEIGHGGYAIANATVTSEQRDEERDEDAQQRNSAVQEEVLQAGHLQR